MPLKLMYITNNPKVAKYADEAGVDWIFVDLEKVGKLERQGHIDSVKSNHSIQDINIVKKSIKNAKLLVRINPIHKQTEEEIENVISNGADIIMLPFFKTKKEVEQFIYQVDGRVKTCLLLETPEAVEIIDEILMISNIDYIHIGLNDLHLGYGKKFMFELLTDGTVEKICKKIDKAGLQYGFGGVARLGYGDITAELILGEHYRSKSKMVILSRSFCKTDKIENYEEIKTIFNSQVQEIRNYEDYLSKQNSNFFESNKKVIDHKVTKFADRMRHI